MLTVYFSGMETRKKEKEGREGKEKEMEEIDR